MSIFKCKMCGGTLEIQSGQAVAECEYCGAKQTLPRLDDERLANLYDRANHLRRGNEFDKASAIYEQILNEDNTDSEAYWSLVLCRYGVEYVEDPMSHRRIPTVNRAQFTSIFDDDNYKSAIENADSYQRIIYEEEAKAINDIQREILAISEKEEPFEIFICYKESDNSGRRTQDSVLAQELYYQLKQENFKTFFARITLEDKLGTAYEPYIFAALNSARVMVVLGTKAEYFNAVWVKNEWSRYLALIKAGAKKTLIPAYRDMDPYDLPQEFSHLQAQDMSKLGFMQDLIRGIKKILGKDKVYIPPVQERVTKIYEGHENTAPLLRRAFLFLEDCEYESADEYAERVLDIDPECAEAYVVKLLIEYSLKREEDLAGLASPFSTSHNYEKAVRFASSDYRAKLEGYNSAIVEKSDKEHKKATYSRALSYMSEGRYDGAIELFESIDSYKDSREKIFECKEIIENNRLESIYKSGCELISQALYDDARDLFVTIPDYKDAKSKAVECQTRKENARKSAIYTQALARVSSKLANDVALKKSIEELNSISGYSDADEKIRELSLRLDAWYEAKRKAEEAARIKAEEVRRARERAEELRKIRIERNKKIAKKSAAIGIPSLFAIATVLILIFTLVIPLIRFNQAEGLIKEGKFDEALEICSELGDFSNSKTHTQVLTAISTIKKENYNSGIEEILRAGIPVTVKYTLGGGDFSGTDYIRADEIINASPASLVVRNNESITDTPAASAIEEFTYTTAKEFNGTKTPGRNGYRFVGWERGDVIYTAGKSVSISLQAKWSDKEYTLTYELDGGSFSNAPKEDYSPEDDSFTLINPTREGYTFIGWTGGGYTVPTETVTIEKGSYGDREYIAHYRANTYTVTLDLDGGSLSDTTLLATYDESLTLPTPTRVGYTFLGWYNATKRYISGTWRDADSITLKAKWSPNTYTVTFEDTAALASSLRVTFDYNYKGSTPNTVTLAYGQKLNYPTNPTRSGYIFAGWYTDSSCTKAYNFKGAISDDMKLYAGWTNCTVVNSPSYPWSIVGGVLTSTNKFGESQSTYKITATTPVTISFSYKTSSESGCDKLIISKNDIKLKECSGDTSYVSYSVALNTNEYLTFKYEKDYYINGGQDCAYIKDIIYTSDVSCLSTAIARSNDIAGYEYSDGNTALMTATFDSNYTLPELIRPGYIFIGWYNGKDKLESGKWNITNNITLAPKWQAKNYTVTLNGNGGSVSQNSVNTTYDEAYSLPTPTKTGYIFLGWYNGEDKVEGTTWNIDDGSAITLLARWDEDTYSVSYDLAGGTNGTGNPDSYTVNRGFTLTAPSKHGYTFLGWTYEGQTTPVVEVTVPVGTAGNKSYTANWQVNSYTLTLDPNGGSVTPKSMSITFGDSFTLPTPTKTCGEFKGWYVGTRKLESGIWNEAEGLIAVAKWEASHTPDSAVEENRVEANCTKDGSYDSVVYCTVCDEEISRQTNVIPAGHNFVDGNCTECGEGEIKYYTRDGNYIYFGEYPQTIKADSVTITSTTDSRGYYLGSDGYYYAKVTASPYGSGYTFSTGTTVTSGTVYYFKVEPIRWRILSENGESAFILCDSIIAKNIYDSSTNNYKDSDIRAWLNATFYQTAFNEFQREIILTTTVDNGAASTGYESNPYACEDTEDKIFLLSYDEVTNSDYGFSSSFSNRDSARQMQTSDYSRAMGSWMSTDSSYYGNGRWWLRSPDNNDSIYASRVYADGFGYHNYVYAPQYSVVPALNIRL